MLKLWKVSRTNNLVTLVLLASALIPFNIAHALIEADADGQDDSAVIAEHLQNSLQAAGLVSVEQHTGRLLYNPEIKKLSAMSLKKQFLIPAIVVNQTEGLKLVSEMPFSCFMLSSKELESENYQGYRQHQTMQYIRNVKEFPVSRALICEPAGKSAVREWRRNLALESDVDPFVFQEHTTDKGDHFFYFLNTNGSFEMYF